MMRSTLADLHLAVIMDGNGRWATMRGLPRVAGHRAGADALRCLIQAAPEHGIGVVTVYAFSSDNWRRPADEVSALMRLLRTYLARETERCVEEGVRISLIGRRDRLPGFLLPQIEKSEHSTQYGSRLHLRLAIDYSSRDAILEAARSGDLTREALSKKLGPDVDLLIRTGGEQRLSDFLLWECAYAEFSFSRRMWPDFGAEDLAAAMRDFRSRERRFGAVPIAAVG